MVNVINYRENKINSITDVIKFTFLRLKEAAAQRLPDRFLGTMKLPRWFKLGNNELRYILW